jgi:hypothetical protein
MEEFVVDRGKIMPENLRISELIQKLEAIKNKHGDLETFAYWRSDGMDRELRLMVSSNNYENEEDKKTLHLILD